MNIFLRQYFVTFPNQIDLRNYVYLIVCFYLICGADERISPLEFAYRSAAVLKQEVRLKDYYEVELRSEDETNFRI
jgi:hypothetical protein